MMDKDMIEVLRVAAAIIGNELTTRGEVKIAGFGKFYVTEVKVSGKRFGKDTGEGDSTVKVVRFKPFTQLKSQINNEDTIQVEEPSRDWIKEVGNKVKVKEGEPDRNEPEVTVGDPDLGITATNEVKSVKINEVDVTEHVNAASVEIKEKSKKKDPPKSPQSGGGLLGGFGGSGSALLGG